MKKILSILSTISLSTIMSTNVISCKKSDVNDDSKKTIKEKIVSQQPPKDSNGKLMNIEDKPFNIIDDKYYFVIGRDAMTNNGNINKFKNDKETIVIDKNGLLKKEKDANNNVLLSYGKNLGFGNKYSTNYIKGVYRGNKNNEPTIPTIVEKTGEITNGNEIIETK